MLSELQQVGVVCDNVINWSYEYCEWVKYFEHSGKMLSFIITSVAHVRS